MNRVETLISQKLETLITAANMEIIYSRRKAITALFPHVIWREKNGQNRMLDTFIHTARASQDPRFMWCWIIPFFTTLLDSWNAVPLKQAALLASPHLLWWGSANGKQIIQLWAAAASIVPYSDEIGASVVDTLLRIASNPSLGPHIPSRMWLWLNRQPNLPPVCAGRYLGSSRGVVKAARANADLRTLKSYLLLVWSEWDYLYHKGHLQMCTLIREDFSGGWMGDYRKDLLEHLDYILGQLDMGLDHLQKHKPSLDMDDIEQMKEQYKKLKEAVLVEDHKVAIDLTCESSRLIIPLGLLTTVFTYRETLNIHVCPPPPMPIVVSWNISHSSCFEIHRLPTFDLLPKFDISRIVPPLLQFLHGRDDIWSSAIYTLMIFHHSISCTCVK